MKKQTLIRVKTKNEVIGKRRICRKQRDDKDSRLKILRRRQIRKQ